MKRKSTLISKAVTIFALVSVAGHNVFAAACCGGSSAMPSVISGDHRSQVTAGYARGTVIGDAPEAGIPVFRSKKDSDVTQTFRLDAARIFEERFQAGVSLPVMMRAVRKGARLNQKTAAGDLTGSIGYEILPEYSYSSWKPKGVAFVQTTAPTGISIYESQMPHATDVTGRGFFTLGAGTLFTKNWGFWDALVLGEVHHSFQRQFTTGGEALTVYPGFGGSFALGGGVNPRTDLRFGMRVQPTYNQPRKIKTGSGGDLSSSRQQYCDVTLEASYLFSNQWSLMAAYIDQTLLGPAINSTLSRTASVFVQKRWDR